MAPSAVGSWPYCKFANANGRTTNMARQCQCQVIVVFAIFALVTILHQTVAKVCSGMHSHKGNGCCYTLQSEQMAAELARHLGVPGPLSRILLKQHDREEWDQLALHAAEVCPSLADMLEKKVTQLQGTTHAGVFVPACSRKSWREILCRTVLVLRSVFFFFPEVHVQIGFQSCAFIAIR